MRKLVLRTVPWLLLCAVLGCKSESYGMTIKQVIRDLQDLNTVYGKISMEEQVTKSLPRVREINKRLQEDAAKLREVDATPQEKERTRKKYGAVVASLLQRFQQEQTRVGRIKEGSSLNEAAELPTEVKEFVKYAKVP